MFEIKGYIRNQNKSSVKNLGCHITSSHVTCTGQLRYAQEKAQSLEECFVVSPLCTRMLQQTILFPRAT